MSGNKKREETRLKTLLVWRPHGDKTTKPGLRDDDLLSNKTLSHVNICINSTLWPNKMRGHNSQD